MRARGINSILDIFYIDGKPAAEFMPAELDSMVQQFMSDNVKYSLSTDATPASMKDALVKAVLMYYISMGEHQVSIANYQEKKEGGEDLVITDLNVYTYTMREEEYIPGLCWNDARGNSDLAMKSRKNRTKNHNKIRAHREKMREAAHA